MGGELVYRQDESRPGVLMISDMIVDAAKTLLATEVKATSRASA